MQVDPYLLVYFVVQYFFIVVAPVFLAAAIYFAFGRLILLVGSASPVRPRLIFGIFLAFDIVTTIIQVDCYFLHLIAVISLPTQ